MRCLSAVLRNPELLQYDTAAFLTYTRMGTPINEILNKGIPQTSVAAQSFLRFLMEGNQVADAEATWHWISEKSLGDEKTTGEFITFLIRNKQEEHAADIWETLNSKTAPDYRHRNWIFNSGFESDPRPSPLDWHLESTEDVEASRVQATVHDGRMVSSTGFRRSEQR